MNTPSLRLGIACVFLLSIRVGVCAEEPTPEVPVLRAVLREITDFEEFTGRTEAALRVDLRPRVTSYLVKTAAEEGAAVKKGDVLFELDPRPYQAELDRAEATLKAAQASLRLAEGNYQRAKKLQEQKAIGQDEFDRITAQREETRAKVAVAEATVLVHRLNLDFTRVVAPIDGRIGRRSVDPGNLVKADETILATIVSVDPMYVFFDVDERTFLRMRLAAEGKGKAEKVPVAVALGGEESFSRRGQLRSTDNQVNPETGTLRMKAVLSNKDGRLIPGLFVRVRLAIGAPYMAVRVPDKAVMTEDGERFVFVVNDRNVIERRTVTVGQASEGQRVVKGGLKADERVVIGRLHELQPGMTVRPREEEKSEPKPKPSSERGRSSSAAPSVRGQGVGGILVEAAYPGASAEIVADTVRLPLEQEINGVEKLRTMRSRCTSDGRYALALTFARWTDMRMMQVLVQNRATLAMPHLPQSVLNSGVNVKRAASGATAIITLTSPDDKYDRQYLSNYANIQIKEELERLADVADVTLLGEFDFGMRVRLDPDRLAAVGLSVVDAVRAIEKQKAADGLNAERLEDLIFKADGEGHMVRLKDVANLDLSGGPQRNWASVNGKPVVALLVRTFGEVAPRKMRSTLQDRLAELDKQLPDGIDLAVSFDFTTDADYLLVDVDSSSPLSADGAIQRLKQAEKVLRLLPEVRDTLALSANPFDLFGGGPCVLIALTPADKRKAGRDQVVQTLRRKLAEIKDLSVRVRDLSAEKRSPHFGYPIDLAVRGPELPRVRVFAQKLAARLGKDDQLTDVWMNRDSLPRPQRIVDIDRTAAAERGVSMDDIATLLRIREGAVALHNFTRFGRTWPVQVQLPGSGDLTEDLRKLKVRGARGQMVPLAVLVRVREIEAPLALDFVDIWPMVEITTNPAAGVNTTDARKRCETLAEEVRKEMRLPAKYRLVWLP